MSAILDDQKKTGISIMKLDEKMDHGPILVQEKILVSE
jgi:methionyl-tRNA formyltransferase